MLSFDREKRSIPGIHNSTRRKVLIEQLLESVRRVKYVEVIRTLKLSNRRADPNDDLFDPLKAAILCQRRRNIQDVKSNMVFGHFLNQQQRGIVAATSVIAACLLLHMVRISPTAFLELRVLGVCLKLFSRYAERVCLLFIHPRAPNLINLRSASTMPA